MTAAELEKEASQYTESDVQGARIYMHYNGDHKGNTNNYLREVRFGMKKMFRVTAPGEFKGEKEMPENFKDNAEDITFYLSSGFPVTLKELNDFLNGKYSNFILKNATRPNERDEIDYIGVLDYLNNNQEIPYTDPKTPGISRIEKERFEEIEDKGQWAVNEMNKIANKCDAQFNLYTNHLSSWLDGSTTKTSKRLCAQLKYKANVPVPITE